MKKITSLLCIFVVMFFMQGIVVNAAIPENELNSPALHYCPVNGAKHIPTRRYTIKVKIDGESSERTFSVVECACHKILYYDGIPNQGFVANYFYESAIYDHGTDNFNNTVVYVHSTNYLYGMLPDWDFFGGLNNIQNLE